MIRDRYVPLSLFDLVPRLQLQFEPALAVLDQLLDDDDLFQQVKTNLATIARTVAARPPLRRARTV